MTVNSLLSFLLVIILSPSVQPTRWKNHVKLDDYWKFQLFWTPGKKEITMEVQVATRGHFELGFTNPHNSSAVHDVLVGWVPDKKLKAGIIKDGRINAEGNVEIDDYQNYQLIRGYQNTTHTTIMFRRQWNTCDDKGDYPLGLGGVRVTWAYFHDDPYPASNFGNLESDGLDRGSKVIVLDLPQRSPVKPSSYKTWPVRMPDVEILPDVTSLYWCKIFKPPDMESKNWIVGYEGKIESGHESLVQHMLLYECDTGREEDKWEAFVKQRGRECYTAKMPEEWFQCKRLAAVWGIRSKGILFPRGTGMPIGEVQGGASFYMLQAHYVLKKYHGVILDGSGFDIYYTDRRQKYDAGGLTVGHQVHSFQMVPPMVMDFATFGWCIHECMDQPFQETGINIFAVFAHTHSYGRKIILRHLRNETEMLPIVQDNGFNYKYQETRKIYPPINVKLGDSLVLECHYNTEKKKSAVWGGLDDSKEVCLAFLLYYPRTQLANCVSRPTGRTLLNAVGVEKLEGFENYLESQEEIDELHMTTTTTTTTMMSSKVTDVPVELMGPTVEPEPLPDVPESETTVAGNIAQPEGEEAVQGMDRVTSMMMQGDAASAGATESDEMMTSNSTMNQTPPEVAALFFSEKSFVLKSDVLSEVLELKISLPESLAGKSFGEYVQGLDWGNSTFVMEVQRRFLEGNLRPYCVATGGVDIKVPVQAKKPDDVEFVSVDDVRCETWDRLRSKAVSSLVSSSLVTLICATMSGLYGLMIH